MTSFRIVRGKYANRAACTRCWQTVPDNHLAKSKHACPRWARLPRRTT